MSLFSLDDVVVFGVTEDDVSMAGGIAKEIAVKLGEVRVQWFGGCPEVRFGESVRGKFVVIVSCVAGDVCKKATLMENAVRAAYDSRAERILVVLTYDARARSDKKDKSGIAYGFKFAADKLKLAGAWSVLLCDLHNDATGGLFDSCDVVSARALLLKQVSSLGITVMASPDEGGIKRTKRIARSLGLPYGIADKSREGPEDAVNVTGVMGAVDFAGQTVLIVEDETATGQTARRTTAELLARGAEKVIWACTHAPFRDRAEETMWGPGSAQLTMITTNTVPITEEKQKLIDAGKIVVIDVAPLFGEAVRGIVLGQSIWHLCDARE